MSAALERRALSLGAANAIDYALQFLLPIVLTRALDAEAFGQYRLLWLAAATLMTTAPLFMPQSLYYFLPRSDRDGQRLYINQTLAYLIAVGFISAWAISVWNPLLPGSLAALSSGGAALVPIFVLLWMVSSLLDVLPTVDERVGWQARAIVGLSALRTIALATAALVTHDFVVVLWTLVGFSLLKLALLGYYIWRMHGLGGPWLQPRTFAKQVAHAAPFGFSGMMYGLRSQADQWVAAALFSVAMFASFSIAAVLGPMVNLFRQSVNHVFLPSMSRLQSSGDVRAMLAMNSRANAIVALFVYPLLAFAFVFAEPLIALVYTSAYLDAVPVLRLYIVGLLAFVVELNSILLLMKQGGFAARVNAAALAVSVPLSLWGALHLGLPGAALGSVAMIYAERLASLRRIATLTDTPVSRLQEWGKLVALAAAAALAAGAAGAVTAGWSLPPLGALAAGAAIMAIAYPAALLAAGQRGLVTGLIQSHAAPPDAAPSKP